MKLTIPIATLALALSSASALPVEAGIQDLVATGGFASSLFSGITHSFKDMFSAHHKIARDELHFAKAVRIGFPQR